MAQLYFYYSSMNAGKSTSLLQSAYNYRERGLSVLLFTAALDDRHSLGRVASRIGLSEEAELFDGETEMLASVQYRHVQNPISCVLVDEAQFLTEAQVWQLSDVVDHLNIPVLCYGLRTDFRGELFSGSRVLLAIAEKITELKTICHCGRKATMVVRIGESGEVFKQGAQVEIGGNDRYVSLCRKHQKQAMQSGYLASDQML